MEVFDVGGGEVEESGEVGDPVREVGKGRGGNGVHSCGIVAGLEGMVVITITTELCSL